MYKTIATRVPPETINEINYFAEEEKTDKSQIMRELLMDGVKQKLLKHALAKYSRREISMGRAAEISRMTLGDFMIAEKEHLAPMNYPLFSLEKDFSSAQKAK
ncbi:hypothetical protein HYU13_06375 [Candidatus Woesearchaeota archaeon]|nr:hypothetical protein [Candidatus Woesearchaeota archaeon]